MLMGITAPEFLLIFFYFTCIVFQNIHTV